MSAFEIHQLWQMNGLLDFAKSILLFIELLSKQVIEVIQIDEIIWFCRKWNVFVINDENGKEGWYFNLTNSG